MRYKLTLLKDLPEYEAGTEFSLVQSWEYDEEYLYLRSNGERVFGISEKTLNNPAWFKKEIDTERLADLACPVCGSTRGVFFSHSFHNTDMDSYDYGTHFSVGFECECGNKRVLYGTGRGNKRLRERLKEG